MKAVLQRVKKGRLTVQNKLVSKIAHGLIVLVSVGRDDEIKDAVWLANKILALRIFSPQGKLSDNIAAVDGELLMVSQFTLHANTSKGKCPSFENSASREKAFELFNQCVNAVRENYDGKVVTGKFGEDMIIELVLNGPLTICLDSKSH